MTELPEYYSHQDLEAMSHEELLAAQARGWRKPPKAAPFANPTAYREAETVQVPSLAAPPQAPENPYAATTWGSPYFDFVTPSGQKCQMQKLLPEKMLGTGLIDRVTRLPAFAQEAIDKAEGLPPAAVAAIPDAEQVAQVVEVVNELVPLVVVQPKVYPLPPEGEERIAGRIYVDSIELGDRVAIMERAVRGVAALDRFRQQS